MGALQLNTQELNHANVGIRLDSTPNLDTSDIMKVLMKKANTLFRAHLVA